MEREYTFLFWTFRLIDDHCFVCEKKKEGRERERERERERDQ